MCPNSLNCLTNQNTYVREGLAKSAVIVARLTVTHLEPEAKQLEHVDNTSETRETAHYTTKKYYPTEADHYTRDRTAEPFHYKTENTAETVPYT